MQDKMEAMARDLSSFQEQKDVLQAQIATLLAEREDEAAAASNDKFEVSHCAVLHLTLPALCTIRPSVWF